MTRKIFLIRGKKRRYRIAMSSVFNEEKGEIFVQDWTILYMYLLLCVLLRLMCFKKECELSKSN
jgi:hypothetical protein